MNYYKHTINSKATTNHELVYNDHRSSNNSNSNSSSNSTNTNTNNALVNNITITSN